MDELVTVTMRGEFATNDNIRQLLGFLPDALPGTSSYQFMPPILLGGSDSDDELDRMFKNPIIERVCFMIFTMLLTNAGTDSCSRPTWTRKSV
jgi:hypothetical protein